MQDMRLDTLAADVVAWHNRNPFARRITASQVAAMGWVVLPFVQPGAPLPNPPAAIEPALGPIPPPVPDPIPEPELADAPALSAAADAADTTTPGLEAPPQAARDDWAPDGAAATSADPATDTLEPQAAAATPPSLRERLAQRPATVLPVATTPPAVETMPAVSPVQAGPAVFSPAAPGITSRRKLRADFTDPFYEHASVARVVGWAARHAQPLRKPLPAEDAVKRVPRASTISIHSAASAEPEQALDLLVRTATVEAHGRRLRVLVAPPGGKRISVLGPRLISPPRTALLSLPLVLVLAGGSWGLMAGRVPAMAAAQHAPQPPETAAQAGHEPPGAALPAVPRGVEHAAAPVAMVTAAPLDVEPQVGEVLLPPIGYPGTDTRLLAAQDRREAARKARQPPLQGSAVPAVAPALVSPHVHAADPGISADHSTARPQPSPPPAAPAATPSPRPPAVASKPEFALATRVLRTSAESEQVAAAMRVLLGVAGDQAQDGGARVERVRVGDDWRVIGGPFPSEAAASELRQMLLARGVRTEVMPIPGAAPR